MAVALAVAVVVAVVAVATVEILEFSFAKDMPTMELS